MKSFNASMGLVGKRAQERMGTVACGSGRIRSGMVSFLGAMLLTVSAAGYAAPGTIANTPLFLKSTALPNIFFMIDDSGSMDMDLLTPEPTLSMVGGATGLMEITTDEGTYGYIYATYASDNAYPVYSNWGGVVPTQEAANATGAASWMTGVWRARNPDYNKMYYDPDVTYEPWAGVDSDGGEYQDANYAAARKDPFNADSQTVNLSSTQSISTRRPCDHAESSCYTTTSMNFSYMPMRYWVWEDTNTNPALAGNGDVDETDTHTLIQITSGHQCGDGQTPIDDGCYTRTFEKERQNFANWWTYHRRREYGMKYSVGKVIANVSNVRAGAATIWANSSSELSEVAEIGTDTASGSKRDLMDTIYSIHSTGGTPLLEALKDTGEYFDCDGTNLFGNSHCPIQTSAELGATEAAGACQQNFAILMTDGYYTDSISGIDNADNDGSSWSEGGVTYKFDGNPYGDSRDDTLADIAMEYYERDLNGVLSNKVPTQCGVDENPGQHMVTYTVAFGVEGAMDQDDLPARPQYGYDPEDTSCEVTTASAVTWTNPATDDGKIDELLHAAYNGRGKFFSADNPSSLVSSMQNALQNVLSRTGSAAAVSFNSTTLGTDTAVYLALFDSSRWSGDLIAYPLDPITGAIESDSDWKAATKLDDRSLTGNPRTVITFNGGDGIAFDWATINALGDGNTLYDDLTFGAATGTEATVGEARLDYIRGDRENEGTGQNYRVRDSRLGDIVHSTPVYVGVPALDWPDTSPFPDGDTTKYSYFTHNTSRDGIVYVGANDGMLHGFNAETGQEVLAYIPGAVYSAGDSLGMHYLTDSEYTHRYYVDMSPSISDAYIDTGTGTSWKTVLVGALGGGGRGLFALDITDPSTFSEDNAADIALWEFTTADNSNLGYTYSQPIIARMNNGEWAAIVGNGYNNEGDGKAKLFVIFLEGGLDGTWTADTDYVEIDTAEGSTGDKNGLSSPGVVDLNGDGTADRVYAGDLYGNMWAFDLSNSDVTKWDVDYKLFTAENDSGEAQPITTAPVIIDHPTIAYSSNVAPNLLVMFGTGQYLTDADTDVITAEVQSFYAVWDEGTGSFDRSDLQEQDIIDHDANSTVPDGVRIMTDEEVAYNGTGGNRREGWYIDFDTAETGERVVVDSIVRGDYIYFNTVVPSPNPCSAGGHGWLMAVATENGGEPDSAVFDYNGDNIVNDADYVDYTGEDDDGNPVAKEGHSSGERHDEGLPARSSFLGDKQYTTDTETQDSGDIDQRDIEKLEGQNTGRLSWEELFYSPGGAQ